jgi:hypothetical protein
MNALTFPYSLLLLTVVVSIAAIEPLLADEAEVVSPITGETVAISEIDFNALTNEQRAEVGDQLAELGINPGNHGRGRGADASEAGKTEGPGRGRGGEGPGGHGARGPGAEGAGGHGDDRGRG